MDSEFLQEVNFLQLSHRQGLGVRFYTDDPDLDTKIVDILDQNTNTQDNESTKKGGKLDMVEKVVARINKNLRLPEEHQEKESSQSQESLNRITLNTLAQADIEEEQRKIDEAQKKHEKELED